MRRSIGRLPKTWPHILTRSSKMVTLQLRREIWVDADGKIVCFNLAFINHDIYSGDNGRVLGYDSQHGVWHRHRLGEVSSVEETSFDEIEARFEAEVRTYLKGRRQ